MWNSAVIFIFTLKLVNSAECGAQPSNLYFTLKLLTVPECGAQPSYLYFTLKLLTVPECGAQQVLLVVLPKKMLRVPECGAQLALFIVTPQIVNSARMGSSAGPIYFSLHKLLKGHFYFLP